LTILPAVLALAAAVAGCSGGGKTKAAAKGGGTAASPTTTPGPPSPGVTVTAREYAFDAPSEIEGGVVRLTLKNDGKLKHEAVVVAAGDTPLPQLEHDLAPIVKGDGKPTPAYLHFSGGVSLVPGGTSETSTLSLPAGRYVLVCTLTDVDSLDSSQESDKPPSDSAEQFHFERGMAVPFTVKATNSASMPSTDGTVTARDWSFDLPSLAPGDRTLTFHNAGRQDHSLAVAEFADGVSAAAAKAAFEKLLRADATHPPPDGSPTPEDLAFAGPLSAGGRATFSLALKPNRSYVFACYMSDRSGGPLHAAGKHMVVYATTGAG
jgi:hypothetical protein